jgi:hypothetical protein
VVVSLLLTNMRDCCGMGLYYGDVLSCWYLLLTEEEMMGGYLSKSCDFSHRSEGGTSRRALACWF